MRRGNDGDDGVRPRWMGLAGRRSTADGQHQARDGDSGGEGLIAREIREQRERELQLLIQRRQAIDSTVTSPCRDDVSVTSSSLGEPETKTQTRPDNDFTAQSLSRESKLTTERDGLPPEVLSLMH